MVFSNKHWNTFPVPRLFNLLSDLKVENNITASLCLLYYGKIFCILPETNHITDQMSKSPRDLTSAETKFDGDKLIYKTNEAR